MEFEEKKEVSRLTQSIITLNIGLLIYRINPWLTTSVMPSVVTLKYLYFFIVFYIFLEVHGIEI
jgi:hypothetical protein